MRKMQLLNGSGRRLVSAAAAPQADSESMDTAAFLIHSSATSLTDKISEKWMCQSKDPPGCLLAAQLWGWLWVVWLTDDLVVAVHCNSNWSSCCAAINSSSNRPDASLPSLSTPHPLWHTFKIFFNLTSHIGEVQTISLTDLHGHVSLPG